MSDGSTRTLAIRGATWATAGVGLQRVVQTLSVLVLARLLVPEDFGLVAIAVLVLNFVNRAKTLGLHTSLIQHTGDTLAAADACFIINGCLTTITIVVVLAASPLASRIFGDPRAGALLALMSLRLIPQALAAVPSALAVKALNFRKQALIQAAEGLTSAAVAVALALSGWGPWSLVAGFLAGSAVGAALWWVRPGWNPRLHLDREVTSHLLHTGIRIWSAGNLAHLIDGANRLFIGGILGLIQLGHYEILSRIVHAPMQSLLGIHDRITISAFCREQDDRKMVGRWFLRLSGLMLILTSLVAGPLFLFSDILIPTLFGPGWEAAIEPAQALALFTFLAPLLSAPAVFVAMRQTGLLLKFTTIRAAITLGFLFAAAHISLTAVCTVESLAALVFAPINVVLVSQMTGLRIRAVLSTLSVPAAGLLAFAVTALGARFFFPHSLNGPGLGSLLGLLIPSGAALALTVFGMRPHLIGEIRSIVSETAGTRANPYL
ncbi:MAG: oligosaccharide flippase family protein [Acidobacteriota bacterium]